MQNEVISEMSSLIAAICTVFVSVHAGSAGLSIRAEIHKYYEECDWSKKWAEGLQKILT